MDHFFKKRLKLPKIIGCCQMSDDVKRLYVKNICRSNPSNQVQGKACDKDKKGDDVGESKHWI